MSNNKNRDFIQSLSDGQLFELMHGSAGRVDQSSLSPDAARERELIVSWMKRCAEILRAAGGDVEARAIVMACKLIERGEHNQ